MKYFILSLLFITTTAFGGWFDSELEKQNQADINIIKNSGAENGLSGWSEIGAGTFITSSVATDVGRGTTSFAMDMASGADSLESDGALMPNEIASTLCLAEMKYKGAGTADIIFEVEDADGDTLGSTTIVDSAADYSRAFFTFICPSRSGTLNDRTLNVKLSTAGNPAPIIFDSVFVGVKSLTEGAAGGWKTYDENDVSITGANWSTNEAYLVPYKDPINGGWRLRFNIQGTLSAGTTISTINIAGVTSGTASQGRFHVGVYTGLTNTANGFMNDAAGSIVAQSSSSATDWEYSGDIPLASKPTWADFDGTVNLLNNSVIYSNAKASFYVNGDTSVATIDGLSESIPFDATTYNEGGFTLDPTGFVTVNADGYYEIKAGWGITSTFAAATQLNIYKNGATVLKKGVNAHTTFTKVEVGGTVYLVAGDRITIRGTSTSGITSVRGVAEQTFFDIERVADVSSESALGFGEADADNYGLVSKEVTDVSLSLSTDATFTSGGDIVASRSGNVVTLTGTSAIHASSATPATSAGFLPEVFRPSVSSVFNVYVIGGSSLNRVQAKSDGGIAFSYYTYAGAAASLTSTTSWYVSYSVAP